MCSSYQWLWMLWWFSHSVVSNSVTPWTAARQASLSFTIPQSLLKLMNIELVMPFNHLILYHPPLLLPSIFPSIRVFSNKLALCIRWPKYWSFSFSISPSNKYLGFISFKIDWFDLLPVLAGWILLDEIMDESSSKQNLFCLPLSKDYEKHECSSFILQRIIYCNEKKCLIMFLNYKLF